MTINKELDMLLVMIADHPGKFLTMEDIRMKLKRPAPDWRTIRYVNQLISDGHIERYENNVKSLIITVKGERFRQRGGYKGESKRQCIQDAFNKVKLGATVLYSLAVLAVAVWAVWVEIQR